MEVAIEVKNKLIEGELMGTLTAWKFLSDSEYFVQHFPSHETNSAFFAVLYSVDNTEENEDKEAIYDELYKTARFFLDTVPEAFNDNRYRNLFKLTEEMSVANKNVHITYVCAPVKKDALKAFREKYFPDNTRNFKPAYNQAITIYEVKRMNVPYSEEVDYNFCDIYGKSIIAE